MKLNNKGFTLVELLAVIVILIMIVSVAIPTISASIQRTHEKQKEAKKKLIITNTELYLTDHKKARKDFYNRDCYIDVVENLINNNYLKQEEVTQNKELVARYVIYDSDGMILIDNLTTTTDMCS